MGKRILNGLMKICQLERNLMSFVNDGGVRIEKMQRQKKKIGMGIHLMRNEKTCNLRKRVQTNEQKNCIGKYELMIDENDSEHMFDYLINKEDAPFMKDGKEGGEEKKFEMIGTPSERT
ncbi:hypothetical protein Tco_1502832 [Tanacetum coccineum]